MVLVPSLGTSVTALWGQAARLLADDFQLVGIDLPGHGHDRSAPTGLTMADLAADVLATVDRVTDSLQPVPFHYAGDSVGGAIGLQLLLDAPSRVLSASLLCTGARIGTEESWRERMVTVTASGTPAMVAGSSQRWFGPGFLEREPEVGGALLHSLSDAGDAGYVAVCEALATFDVRDRLDEIAAPVLAVAGSEDVATPVAGLDQIAEGVQDGRLVVLDGVGHLAPVEAVEETARLVRAHALGEPLDAPEPDAPEPAAPAAGDDLTRADVRAAGMQVRRAVLGDAHVDRAVAATTDLTADFQSLITEYAWGSIWTRPGLDRRSRSLITLTALVARGHHEELAMHVRAARTNGLTVDEIKECLLQTAIYCGVPDANTAFRIAQQVLADELG
ncbi:4-carboxymuconolactone decarboxylase [Nocardioides sp. GY 10127]|nr:4-carboxymuconolactone decarboxylase [Nocardioides sp. GY 10127]